MINEANRKRPRAPDGLPPCRRRSCGGSPAAVAPLSKVWALDPEVGVAAVAGVDHRVVRQRVEDALFQIVYE